ncbi:MAG: glycosyltransferase family 4 protein [Deltaproteobacteria bacterium]|nr:glycosyltransferase family 4 protein [Deltaproteobacteria bacterium]
MVRPQLWGRQGRREDGDADVLSCTSRSLTTENAGSHITEALPTVKIFLFTKHSLSWGSSQERIGIYLEALKKAGHDICVQSLVPDFLSRLWISGSSCPKWIHRLLSFYYMKILSILMMIRLIFISKKFELIVIQKITFPCFLLKMLKQRNPNLIFDFDDLCFFQNDRAPRWFSYFTASQLSYYKHILAGSPSLEKIAKIAAPSSTVTLVPTAIDCTIFRPNDKRAFDDRKVITIGWIGSGENHLDHLQLLTLPLEEVGKRNPLKFVLVGALSSEKIKSLFQSPYYIFEPIDWLGTEELIKTIQSFDIGLMPLANTPQARGKCGYKALAYMACGVPSIISPVGVNLDIIQDGKNGFLAHTQNEWIQKLSLLINNKPLREEFSKQGRNTVKQHYSIEKNIKIFMKLFDSEDFKKWL